MTKEPKLQSAVRIVKEWPDYDNEVRSLQESLSSKMAAGKSEKDKPSGKLSQYLNIFYFSQCEQRKIRL